MRWQEEAEALAAVIGPTVGAADDDVILAAARLCVATTRSSVPR